MQATDIIIDTLLSFNRPVHEQELICEMARRGGLKYEDMLASAVPMRTGLHELCKFGYLQQTEPGWYTMMPLQVNRMPLGVKQSEYDYRRMCDAYLRGSSCSPMVEDCFGDQESFFQGNPNFSTGFNIFPNFPQIVTRKRTAAASHRKPNATKKSTRRGRSRASTAKTASKAPKAPKAPIRKRKPAAKKQSSAKRRKTSSKLPVRVLRNSIKAPKQLAKRVTPQSTVVID